MVSSRPDISSTEAINRDYVLVDWGLSFAISHARHFPEFSPSRIRLPLGRIALNYLLACGGSAYLAEPMVNSAIASGKLFRVGDAPIIERPAYALYARNSKQIALVKESLELVG
jgi:DNA-binding transcriptional LysR family regulator